jgi:hypothetical protein
MAFPGYDVWTQNTSLGWLEKNQGIADMRLVTGLEKHQAESLAERLREMYGDDKVTAIPATEPYGARAGKGRATRDTHQGRPREDFERLHFFDGTHRPTASSANGRELDWFEDHFRAHQAKHAEQGKAFRVEWKYDDGDEDGPDEFTSRRHVHDERGGGPRTGVAGRRRARHPHHLCRLAEKERRGVMSMPYGGVINWSLPKNKSVHNRAVHHGYRHMWPGVSTWGATRTTSRSSARRRMRLGPRRMLCGFRAPSMGRAPASGGRCPTCERATPRGRGHRDVRRCDGAAGEGA